MPVCYESLISVVVVTYNSSSFITETLESIKDQRWENIEVIITDDSSTDNTLEICRRWLDLNNNHFKRTEVISSHINTGLSLNCNRGLQSSRGKWVKFIAGDDLLLPSSLENYFRFVDSNNAIKVVISNIKIIGEHAGFIMIDEKFGRLKARSQLRYILENLGPPLGPSAFFHRETLLSAGGFDERIPMLEDYPLSINLSNLGIRIYHLNDICVAYRMHRNSISNTRGFSDSFTNMFSLVAFPVMKSRAMYFLLYHYSLQRYLNNKQSHYTFLTKMQRNIMLATDLYQWKFKILGKKQSVKMILTST